MGTGVLALMLGNFPYGQPALTVVAQALWCVNILFFTLFSLMFLSRAVFFPESFRRLFHHPVQPLFIGCIPMGFATIVNGMITLWPISAASMVWTNAMWWIDVALSVISVLVVPFYMFTAQEHRMERMTAAWLLPIVPPEVAAASGGLVVQHVAPALGTSVIFVSYVLWAISVLLSMGILTILFLRLTLHKLPHVDMAVSAWLPLGPLGTGAMAMITLGAASHHNFSLTDLAPMALLWQDAGVLVALLLWGLGLWWMTMAIVFTLRYLREGLPFNMGWWGFTFPLGVFDSATYLLAKETQYSPFLYLGTAFTLLLAVLWVIVTKRSLSGMWTARLFRDPSLSIETGMMISKRRPHIATTYSRL